MTTFSFEFVLVWQEAWQRLRDRRVSELLSDRAPNSVKRWNLEVEKQSRETRFLKRACPCGVPASLGFACLLGSISRPVFITLFGLNLDANLHGLSIKASCYSMTLLGIPSWSSMELLGVPRWFIKAGRCSE